MSRGLTINTLVMAAVLTVTTALVASPGCKKKPADDSRPGEGSDMAGKATAMDAMKSMAAGDGMDAMGSARRAGARRPGARRAGALVATPLDRPAGMVVIPKGKNPLAGVDIGKGFGEGWFGKGEPPPAMTPEPRPAEPRPAEPRPAEPRTPARAPTPRNARPAGTAELTYARYVHPDKSFGFRYPKGWHPVAKVGQQDNIPVIIVQVKKDPASSAKGELGALALILPKQAPPSRKSCETLVKIVRKGTPDLKTGPYQPLKGTPLLMFQARHTDDNQPLDSLAICGRAHGRIMFLSYLSVGKDAGDYQTGRRLGKALIAFTSDLLKK
jgi:hypothetical protein